MIYDFEWIEKNKPTYKQIMKGIANILVAEDKELDSNVFLSDNIRSLKLYIFMQENDANEALDLHYLDARVDDIKKWARQGNKDAQFYLEVCNMFPKIRNLFEERG